MGLLTETNAQYYSGQQAFIGDGVNKVFTCTFNTELTSTNFTVKVNNAAPGAFSFSGNVITFTVAPANLATVLVELNKAAIENNYGSYEYISLNDVINNFMVAYIGAGKLIPSVKRTDIMFHAKRGLQEFSYDTLKSIKSQELTIPPSLSIVIPQDYINYVKCSWIDDAGAKHVIYPTRVTSNPKELPVQDADGIPTQDNDGSNTLANESLTEEKWKNRSLTILVGQPSKLWTMSTFVKILKHSKC